MIYSGEHLKEICFPLGGIGTGSIGLLGNGGLFDWEIFNRPNKGSINAYSGFAIQACYPDGRTVTRILQGDWLRDLSGQYSRTPYGGFGAGAEAGSYGGFPHFSKVRFDGKFPIARLTFTDADFPAKVVMSAFNPMIPLDADNSGIPAAFFELTVHSFADDVRYTLLLSVRNPFEKTVNQALSADGYTAVTLRHAGVSADAVTYGDLTVAVDDPEGICLEYWYRGQGKEPISTFWHELCNQSLRDRHYEEPAAEDTCSVGSSTVIGNRQRHRFRFLIAWNVPNCCNYWKPCKDDRGKDITWKNYYATLFADSAAACAYSMKHWQTLFRKTRAFCNALHSATLDPAVIDAVTATLCVLKSPTVLRLEDGTFYGWEGTHEYLGSCEGTCTHVWSYAYALCFLYPQLEQSLRETEFRYNTDEHGNMLFRTQLPLGRERADIPPCLDGQMSTVFKIYRDWKLTGNSRWLRDNWENLTRVLEFAWSDRNPHQWDLDHDGILEGRQHHTLDMELFGPSGWLQGMYLAALKAAGEMADFLGFPEKQAEYQALFASGYQYTKDRLFNGSYFIQTVDLQSSAYTEHFSCPEYWNEDKQQLMYQIGEGCQIDQLLGQWHANICGLGDIFDRQQRQTALKTMMDCLFKPSLRQVDNLWRVFALNDEGGVIMCDYPQTQKKPVIPIRYCEECMTGFEYAFAGLLISEGLIQEGLTVIRAVRRRYDGKKRNPWNEIECGSNYARPMSSFALLPIFSGFSFDLPRKQIGFAPILPGPFRCFWSVGTGWGTFRKEETFQALSIQGGALTLTSIRLKDIRVKRMWADGKAVAFTQTGDTLVFPQTTAVRQLRFEGGSL